MVTLMSANPVMAGIVLSLLAGLATGLGALPVFVPRRISPWVQDGMLGFAAGVMLAATAFSLVVPALEHAGGGWGGAGVVGFGILLGGVFLDLIDRYSPHQHFIKGPEGGAASSNLTRIWLFIIAITIHNFPEGLAVGVATGSGDVAAGLSVAIGIGLQNIPEGLAVAVALVGQGYKPWRVFLISLATGLVEPLGGIVGAGTVALSASILPYALAFAAGAMLFVIMDEIIPETHERGNERIATYMMLVGFVVMMALDTALA
ncbi:MAG TPA: ZIP family metal transporter [Symbiobacteriaceae bacterium]|nr:ZIP family metal transporter [Symbiobacteriaceae bacterium]